MAINNVRPIGDDQAWKAEVEKEVSELKRLLAILNIQFNTRNK
tara:strand:+ start:958 stop:1086 length:129 start_codon:yes stop_codon:yes gene_type:complete